MRRVLAVLPVLATVFTGMVACGGDDEPGLPPAPEVQVVTPTATPTASAVAPTATPVPTQAATATTTPEPRRRTRRRPEQTPQATADTPTTPLEPPIDRTPQPGGVADEGAIPPP